MADNNNQAAFSSSEQTSGGSPPSPRYATTPIPNSRTESRSQASTWADETEAQSQKEEEEESKYDDKNQREETENQSREQTPSLYSSSSVISETLSQPETPPDSQSIPLPLPSTERNHSSRSSTPVSSSTSETGGPPEPFRRSRAPSLSSYIPTREGTPQREGGPQESLEGIEEGEDGEELEEDEENEGDESGGR